MTEDQKKEQPTIEDLARELADMRERLATCEIFKELFYTLIVFILAKHEHGGSFMDDFEPLWRQAIARSLKANEMNQSAAIAAVTMIECMRARVVGMTEALRGNESWPESLS